MAEKKKIDQNARRLIETNVKNTQPPNAVSSAAVKQNTRQHDQWLENHRQKNVDTGPSRGREAIRQAFQKYKKKK